MTYINTINENNNFNQRFICLFSGGKDSALAFSICSKQMEPCGLIICLEKDSSLFHHQDIELIKAQAQRMNMHVDFATGHWKDSPELPGLLKKYVNNGVPNVVFGDIGDEKNYKRKIQLCQNAGATPIMPLWRMPYPHLINLYEKHKIKSIITMVRNGLQDLLGSEFTKNTFMKLKEAGYDPLGEKGEFHSTLVDADFFSSPITYTLSKVEEKEDNFGKKWIRKIQVKL